MWSHKPGNEFVHNGLKLATKEPPTVMHVRHHETVYKVTKSVHTFTVYTPAFIIIAARRN